MAYKKSNIILIILSAALLLLSAGCNSGREYRLLLSIEKQLDEDPKVAYETINSISVPIDERNRALYAVLKIQAEYAYNEPLVHDSLIYEAIEYYTINGYDKHSALAWYSLGYLYLDDNNNEVAAELFMKADSLFDKTQKRYKYYCKQNLAECYYNQGMFVEAINIYNESRDLAHKAGNSRFVSLVSLNMARCYIYLREYDKALENITLAKNQAAAASELYYPILVEEIKLQLYAERKPLEALNRMEELLGSNDWVLDENTKNLLLGDIYRMLGVIDVAKQYYNELLKENEKLNPGIRFVVMQNLLSLSYITQGEDSNPNLFKEYLVLSDSLYSVRNQIDLLASFEKNNSIVNNRNLLIVSCVFLTIVLTILTVYIRIKKIRPDIETLQESSDIGKIIIDDCKQQFMQSKSYELIKEAINTKSVSRENYFQIRNDVDGCFRKFKDYLQSKNSTITNGEFELCVYSVLGIDNKDVAMLQNVGYSTITSVKSRLKKKISPEQFNLIFG